jgi:hypothetical protein
MKEKKVPGTILSPLRVVLWILGGGDSGYAFSIVIGDRGDGIAILLICFLYGMPIFICHGIHFI